MGLLKGINFMGFYFVFVFIFTYACCIHAKSASSNNSTKSLIVQEIMKKVSNLTMGALSKAPQQTKETILKKIENKLKKTTKNIGPNAKKYISLIMEEFKAKMNDVSTAQKKKNVQDDIKVKDKSVIRRNKDELNTQQLRATIESDTKKEIIKDISNKIQTLAQGFMKNAKTIEGKQEILEKIRKRIMDSTKQKHIQLHHKHAELKAYSSLIAQGLEESMRKMLETESVGRRMDNTESVGRRMDNTESVGRRMDNTESVERRMDNTESVGRRMDNTESVGRRMDNTESVGRRMDNTESVERRMDIQALAVIPNPISEEIIAQEVIENDEPENATKQEILKKAVVIRDLEEINKYRVLMSESLNGTSSDPRCAEIVEDICLGILSINQLPCDKGKIIPIESLCNNVYDCSNETDENNCAAQAMEQVRKATKVMSEIEAAINRKCLLATTESGLLMSQNEILRDVLQTQIHFLGKHNNTPLEGTGSKYRIPDDKLVIQTVRDVNKILSTLSYALDGALCASITNPNHQGNTDLRKFNDIEIDAIEELDEVSRESGWSPKSCLCKGQFCEDPACRGACKRVCWQRYTLDHWGCQALNGANSVSLNDICDGKLDCFDETDENFCVIDGTSWKFGAAKSYTNLLDLLTTKSKSYDFIKSRNKFVALHGLVHQLQKQTIRTNTDTHTIKYLRDEAFKLLVTIYDDLLDKTNMDELEDLYLILLAINEKLVTALKGSHTGNENLISTEGCFCRDGQCALRRCNKQCIQSCLAEPVLTKFSCNDVKNHTTPLESICNGIINCPNEEDEKGCVKDVCRAHHLVVLRHNLEKVGAKHRGSIMGEVLGSWKAKVSAALIVAETTERTTRRVMTEIVHRVLHDLVMAFAAMEDYRRSNSELALQEFKGISKIVMHTLKSCIY